MTIQVHTYSNPKDWANHTLYSDLLSAVHICATANMKRGIKEAYPEFQHIESVRNFANSLFSEWYNPESILKQYLALSRIINDEKINDNPLKASFRKNAELILESIRFFVESGIKPPEVKFKNLTKQEILFFDLWRKLEEEVMEFEDHRINLASTNEKEIIIYALNKLRDISEDEVKDKDLHLVLHGFYFITPEQQALINYLRNSNIKITFFNFYEKKYPNTFNFIHAFYNNNFGLPEEEEWIYTENSDSIPESKVADYLLSSYEDSYSSQPRLNKSITAYNSFFDFLQDVVIPLHPLNNKIKQVKRTKSASRIIATNADILNEMLLPYYPDNNSSFQNILNYPIGKFLIKLHQVYDEGKIVFSSEILMSLFSSGWLYDSKSSVNAKNYTTQLQKILPYFTGCSTLDEWISRISSLNEQNRAIKEVFGSYPDDRVIQSVSSPFSKFSYFNVTIEEIQQIESFFFILKDMIYKLFLPNQKRSTLGDHFSKLVTIIQNHHSGFKEVISQLEIDFIKNLMYQTDDSTEFLYDDIQKALQFYLGSAKNEDTIIIPFIEVDGEAFKDNNSPVFFTGLDEEGLPLGTFDLPWPIQPKTFEELTLKYPNLEMHSLRNKSVKQISRYLLYITFKFLNPEQLKLSWIKNFLDRVDLKAALYINQMELKEVPYSAPEKENNDSSRKLLLKGNEDTLKKNLAWKILDSIDVYAEYKQCKKRFYFSYILDSYSDFNSNFIHEFMFSEVVRFVEHYSPTDTEKNKEEIRKMFPQWPGFKFQHKYITTFGKRNVITSEPIKETFKISNSRKVFNFPGMTTSSRNSLYEQTTKSLSHLKNELVNDKQSKLTATPGNHCKFCPHLAYCESAKYPIDKE